MPAVKFFARLDLDPICLFVDGHYLVSVHKRPIGPISVMQEEFNLRIIRQVC